MLRKLPSIFVALAVLLGSVMPLQANDSSVESKPSTRHVQGDKKKHAQKKTLKKSAKKATQKNAKKLAKKRNFQG